MVTPLVSIITPSYNQCLFLEQTILSVLNQSYTNIEYIVIDGGSTDKSVDILRRYSDRLAYWVTEPDRGQAHAVNKGLSTAKGELLGWINSDDILLPTTVQRAVEVFEQEPDIDVVYGRVDRIDETGRILPTPILPKDRVTLNSTNAIGENLVNQAGAFWRRSVMEITGLLNEDLQYSMDGEYWLRMLLAGAKFKRLPETLAQFRLSANTKTVAQTAVMAEEGFGVLSRLLAQPGTAEKLGVTSGVLKRQGRIGLSKISLHVFYGYYKKKDFQKAFTWLIRAHKYYPFVLFNPKWIKLGAARLQRNL